MRRQEKHVTTDIQYLVSNATFYKWKSKFGGIQVSDAKRFKALEEENRRLKKRLAEEVMDNATLNEMLTTNL